MLILNVKEDGLEDLILETLNKYNVSKYFFLDQPFPTIKKTIKNGCNNIALRFSEYESVNFLENMSGMCKWVWVDSFEKYSHDITIIKRIQKMGYKLCFVSPELQGRYDSKERAEVLEACKTLEADAICTKLKV